MHLHIDHLTVKMNPDVIQQSANGQALIINATGDAVAKGVHAAASGAVEGAAKSMVP
jgi:hypothetical protein